MSKKDAIIILSIISFFVLLFILYLIASRAMNGLTVDINSKMDSSKKNETTDVTTSTNKSNLIKVTLPSIDQKISSPLTIEGEAVGNWFFEGDFPIVLTDLNGLIIARDFAVAQSDWMTENFVNFKANLKFLKPTSSNRGVLILKKDNPSGLPDNEDNLKIPVSF